MEVPADAAHPALPPSGDSPLLEEEVHCPPSPALQSPPDEDGEWRSRQHSDPTAHQSLLTGPPRPVPPTGPTAIPATSRGHQDTLMMPESCCWGDGAPQVRAADLQQLAPRQR